MKCLPIPPNLPGNGMDWHSRQEGETLMRKLIAVAMISAAFGAVPLSAHADMVGAAAGAGTGLVVAGPPGAVVGGVVGAVWGKPFWGPSISHAHCWTDNHLQRHCNRHY